MTERVKYIKIVKWSDEDQCYIGYCPGVIGPCCHGDDEVEVSRELCEIVDEWIEIARQREWGASISYYWIGNRSVVKVCFALRNSFHYSVRKSKMVLTVEVFPVLRAV